MSRVIGTAFIVTCSAALLAQESVPVFRAAVSGVRVDVAVARQGRPVTGLSLTDFAIVDSGVVQEAVSLSFDKLPIDVTVALDISGSVEGGALLELRRAVDQLRQRLRPGDRLKLLTFSDRIRRLVDFTDQRVDINQAFGQIAPGGGTAIFDTLAVALSSPATPDRRQLIIAFSDGVDSVSATEPDTLIAVARHSTPTLAFVLTGFIGGRADARSDVDERLFATLAAETGGIVISSAREIEVANTFNRILDDFRSVYVLHYVPIGVPATGFHPLAVRVTRSGQYDVRTRRGYVSD